MVKLLASYGSTSLPGYSNFLKGRWGLLCITSKKKMKAISMGIHKVPRITGSMVTGSHIYMLWNIYLMEEHMPSAILILRPNVSSSTFTMSTSHSNMLMSKRRQ